MSTTVSLGKWMQSSWAFDPTCRQDLVSRKSPWSQQVEGVYQGKYKYEKHKQEEREKSPSEIYLENATVIAFLLVQQLLTSDETAGMSVELGSITVTVERITGNEATSTPNPENGGCLRESCRIQFVNVALRHNQDPKTTFFQSLASILLQLFTRQEVPPDLGGILPRQDHQDDDAGERKIDGNDSDDFESDMMKALSVLDDDGGEAKFVQKRKHRRSTIEFGTFSRLRTQYKGLPTSACYFISDLIDGPSKTSTSFASLQEVLGDLEQILNEPDIFLHDHINTEAKLDFEARLYGRKAEISQLLGVANDVSSGRETGPLEIMSISGYSGSGKSFLVRQVGQYLSATGWLVCHGKFDRMRQSDAFSVVTLAFDSLCRKVQEMRGGGNSSDLDYCSRVSTAVTDALGPPGVDYLAQLIPSLGHIVDLGSKSDSDNESCAKLMPVQTAGDAIMSQQRRVYSLCTFVEAILSAGRPVLFFWDDIQWSDASTMEFFAQLLKHIAGRKDARRNAMVVQAFRDNEVRETESIHEISSSIELDDSINITRIKLSGFSKRALNDIISPVLCLPRRVTFPLSELVHQKTMGNIFFVIETLGSFVDKNILSFDLANRRWTWDTDSIAVMTISDNVAGLLAKKLLCIDKDVLAVLSMASCFGSQVNASVMELLNGMNGIVGVIQHLDAAVGEGLLEKAGPLYMFAHDSIQQSTYELIPKSDLTQLHVDIGLMLISKGGHASSDMIDEIFSSAMSNINMALSSSGGSGHGHGIEFTTSQVLVFAKLNMKAGQKAIGKSDFSLAEVHLNAAVSFLPKNCWADHYELTLQIYDEYSHVLLAQRKLDELHTIVETIVKEAKSIGDTINAHELTISALTLKGSTHEALDHAKSVLDSLGFPFPSSINSDMVTGVVSSLSSSTSTFTADHLRSFPLMTETVPLQAMKIMTAVHMPYSFSCPNTFPMMACQMMQLTLKHGLCLESAEAFANFGYCLCSILRNYEDGYRMGKLSLVILDRFKASNRVAKVYFIIYGFLSVWRDPLQSTIEGLESAVRNGLLHGDHKNAIIDQVVLNRQLLLAGCKLSDLRDRSLRLCRDMYDKSKKVFFSGFNPVLGDLYCVMALTGEAHDEVQSMFGISQDENENRLLEGFAKTGNTPLVQVTYYHRLVKAFWYRDYKSAMEYCEKYDSCTQTRNLLRVTDIVVVVFRGLSSLILSRKEHNEELLAKGEETMKQMQIWAQMGSKWNAENKAALLEAEYHYAMGDSAKAKASYLESIRSAREHKFLHEEALASELFGIFCIEEGDMNQGNNALERAKALYLQWGALKKADAIFDL